MPLLEQVLKKYPTQVKLIYKCFPLSTHSYGEEAAAAAIAAGLQGKFWEFHDAIFKNPYRLSDKKLQSIAQQLQLDMNKFKLDKKTKAIEVVKRDKAEGKRLRVRGTPTIFINGVLVKKRTMEVYEYLIDRELQLLLKQG